MSAILISASAFGLAALVALVLWLRREPAIPQPRIRRKPKTYEGRTTRRNSPLLDSPRPHGPGDIMGTGIPGGIDFDTSTPL